MVQEQILIDLNAVAGEGKVKNLSGKDRGRHAREHYRLDELEKTEGHIVIKIPDYLDSISSSYILGLFSQSLGALGGIDNFRQKYSFSTKKPVILDQINHGIKLATL